jgi:hypothetical protein
MHGLYGVIAGTVIAESIRLITYQYIAAQLFSGPVFPRPVGNQLFAASVMFAVVEGFSRMVNQSRLTMLGTLIVVGAIVYFSTLIVVSKHFRNTLIRTFNQFQ